MGPKKMGCRKTFVFRRQKKKNYQRMKLPPSAKSPLINMRFFFVKTNLFCFFGTFI